ncbi:type III secretion system inner membrane ring subunit SctD [Desulfocurvus sp. DL9XJH121]
MPDSAQIILKFFSGPHMGAEIPLKAGDVVVGRGESCDVILHDSTVAAQHVLLAVPGELGDPAALKLRTMDAQAALIRPLDGGEGEDAPAAEEGEDGLYPFQGEIDWPAATPVMLGTTCMAWQLEGLSWGDIGPAAFLEESRPGEAAPEEAADEASREPWTLPPAVRRYGKLLLALAVVLLLTITFSGGPDTHLAEDMADVLDDAGFGYLQVTQTSIGVTVQGVVPMQADRQKLWQLAGTMDFPVFVDVKVREERAQAVRVALAVRGLFPTVALDGQAVVLTGYFRDKLIEGAAKIWISEDIRHISEIRSSMVYAAQVWPLFRDALVRHKLGDLVVVRMHPGVVEVEGDLDFDQREELEKAKKEVCDALGSPIAFWDSLTAPGFSPEWNASINSSRRSAFAPDAGLAQLFKDAQDTKGLTALSDAPALKAGAGPSDISKVSPLAPQRAVDEGVITLSGDEPVLDNPLGGTVALLNESGQSDEELMKHPPLAVILDEDGNPVLDKDGKSLVVEPLRGKDGEILRDAQGRPLYPVVARDENGEIIRDAQGNPVLLAPGGDGRLPVVARDAEGRVVSDEQGNPVVVPSDEDGEAPRIMTRADGTPARDEQGRLIRLPDANDVPGAASGAGETGAGEGENSSDFRRFGSGTGFADATGKKAKPEDLLGGLNVVGVTMEPVPFISMKDGQRFFTGGKLPSGWIIREITTEKLVLEKDGKLATRYFQRR